MNAMLIQVSQGDFGYLVYLLFRVGSFEVEKLVRNIKTLREATDLAQQAIDIINVHLDGHMSPDDLKKKIGTLFGEK